MINQEPQPTASFKPIEPLISSDYLNSGQQKKAEINPEIFQDGKIQDLRPEPLHGSPYHLQIRNKNTEGYLLTDVVVVDGAGQEVVDSECRLGLVMPAETKGKEAVIAGVYFNASAGVKGKPAIRNLSGIVGPYEDALCQLYADQQGVAAQRRVTTNQAAQSRFVRNFVSRGFAVESWEGVLNITKTYNPSKPGL
ncbi:hypothetical protein M1116_01830 [Patescibacteria group bacterium]|nr:hypothetical protein [Patescibacteria group bacterium]